MLSAMVLNPGSGSRSFCFCLKLLKWVVFTRGNLFEPALSGYRVADDEAIERTRGACRIHHSSNRQRTSYFVCPLSTGRPTDIESLTILRTPKYEAFLDEWERGASVSFDRDLERDERVLLREV